MATVAQKGIVTKCSLLLLFLFCYDTVLATFYSKITPDPTQLLLLNGVYSSIFGYRDQHGRHHRPRFLNGDSNNFTYTRGNTATLYCSIADLGTKTVSWKRSNSTTPITIGQMTFTDDKDYEVIHQDNSPHWNLLIKNVQPKHAGQYECQISTTDKMRRRVYLHVIDNRRIKPPDISISGLLHIDKGQPIRLRCNATAIETPPDAIDWFKDGNKMETNRSRQIYITKEFSYTKKTITSVLEIRNAQMSDTGVYTCRATDLQVTSVNVNILNAETQKRKREDEKLLSTKIADSRKANHQQKLSSDLTLLFFMLVFVTVISSLHSR